MSGKTRFEILIKVATLKAAVTFTPLLSILRFSASLHVCIILKRYRTQSTIATE